MPTADRRDLFDKLMGSLRSDEIRQILQDLGDSNEADLGDDLGNSGLSWQPIGGDASNLSAINLSTKPGRSLTERVTNAMDAVFELRASQVKGDLPRNPRQAAEVWFGRPVSGPNKGLFQWDYETSHDDRHFSVALLSSGKEESPTIDVLDAGIGITPAAFPSTILSLRGGNKIRKFHLIGAFGQGGSSTLGFSDYVIYASRSSSDPSTVAFTIVRVLRLSDDYKENCYAFLGELDDKGNVVVPSAKVGAGPINVYTEAEIKEPPRWQHGTLVRHVGFKLTHLDAAFQSSPGNLYHFLHASLFDPLLPFRLLDLRYPGKHKNEFVGGSRNRLMKHAERKASANGEDDELRHYRPMEFVSPHGEELATIGIEYWVILNWRKSKASAKKGEEEATKLRTSSSELYAQRGLPIIGTLNGQNQGELWTASL